VEYISSDADSRWPIFGGKRPRGSLAAAVLRDRQRELGVRREHDAEFYADNFLRYNTFVKDYPATRFTASRVARVIMIITDGRSDAKSGETDRRLSLHYYTVPTATGRTRVPPPNSPRPNARDASRALKIDELVTKHGAIMTNTIRRSASG